MQTQGWSQFVADEMNAPQGSLENLKKEAKLFLKQHRTQYVPVSQRIRLAFLRFSGLTDREILQDVRPSRCPTGHRERARVRLMGVAQA